MSIRTHSARRDEGAILPLVLVGTFVIAMVIMAVATYVTADLRYANVVEERADRLAAADGGLRYGVEKLRNFQTLCTTNAGVAGVTTVFPPIINGATTKVTCQRVGNPIDDVQGWGVVVTGQGVPNGQPYFTTSGAGQSDEQVKTFSGPVYIQDPDRMDLSAILQIKDGDLWYTRSNCDTPADLQPITDGLLQFAPDFFRGPQCTTLGWNGGLFTPPTIEAVPTSTVNPAYVDTTSCRVFSPGKYTSLTLGTNNYFKAGAYYFENVDVVLQNQTFIAGFPGGVGDSPKLDNSACAVEQQLDQATTLAAGGQGGATFYMGGSSRFEVRNGAGLEIFRRKVGGRTFLAMYALDSSGTGYAASNVGWNQWILETKSGSNNDVAIHGLAWVPSSGVSLGNITNAANGQLLGGIVVANLDTQASASASAFLIGIETNPADTRLLLISTATKNGRTTVIRAIVQFRPDSGELAVNSWRVVG